MKRALGKPIAWISASVLLFGSACSNDQPSSDKGADSAAGSSGATAGPGGPPATTAGMPANAGGAAGVTQVASGNGCRSIVESDASWITIHSRIVTGDNVTIAF